jgi:nicotinamidase-related amidase
MAARTALLIIDVQQGLFEKPTPVYHADELLGNLCHLIEEARRAEAPVFFIQHANQSFLAEGSPGWQLHPGLQPEGTDLIVHKRHGSAFQDTLLKAELDARSVDTLVITGLVTNGCVRATCEAALKQGYRVILASDAHSTYQKKAATLIDEWNQRLGEQGAEPVETAAIRFESA